MAGAVEKVMGGQVRAPSLIQYASCLYANRSWPRALDSLTPAGKYLALLGNCVSAATEAEAKASLQFLLRCASNWDRVFVVPGPLEYMSNSRERQTYAYQVDKVADIVKEVNATKQQERLVLMDQAEYAFAEDDVVLLGAYGGTAPEPDTVLRPEWPEANIWTVRNGRVVRAGVDGLATLHESDVDWLYDKMQWYALNRPKTRCVVLTHSLCSKYLLAKAAGQRRWTAERRGLEIMGAAAANRLAQNTSIYVWLCGASPSSVSGFVGKSIFAAVNGCYDVDGARNPLYAPNRTLGLEMR